jgi:NodT family efflux transporter outer membrane factor (OMF) lipoprotein
MLLLGACAVIPDVGPKPQLKPAQAYDAQKSLAAPSADWPVDRWWEAYGDPQLTGLINEALQGSPNLAEAQARLRAASAQSDVARAATLPSLSGEAEVAEIESSRIMGFPPFIQGFLPKGYNGTARLALNASYDLDVFGKNRAALAAAVSEAEAARADLAQARLTLSTAVAQAYGDLARLLAEHEAADEAVRNRQDTVQLVAKRLENGLDTRAELKQAEAATPTSLADLEALDEQILIKRHQIAALLGAGPDRGLAIAAPPAEKIKAFGLPPDVTLGLVGRRPDVAAARLRAQAAAKQIDVARAAFFPDITLNAYVGQQSLGIPELFDPAAAIGKYGPALTLPIFEGGRLRGAYRGARADYDAAVDAYDATLAQAFEDVADAAVSVQSAERQLEARQQALEAGEEAYSVAKLRYQGGLSTFVDVLAAENAVISERRDLADAKARVFVLDVALVRALGGGFAAS